MPWSSEIFKGALYVNKSLSMQEWCVKDCVCVCVCGAGCENTSSDIMTQPSNLAEFFNFSFEFQDSEWAAQVQVPNNKYPTSDWEIWRRGRNLKWGPHFSSNNPHLLRNRSGSSSFPYAISTS